MRPWRPILLASDLAPHLFAWARSWGALSIKLRAISLLLSDAFRLASTPLSCVVSSAEASSLL
jgi:hypothetical protein